VESEFCGSIPVVFTKKKDLSFSLVHRFYSINYAYSRNSHLNIDLGEQNHKYCGRLKIEIGQY